MIVSSDEQRLWLGFDFFGHNFRSLGSIFGIGRIKVVMEKKDEQFIPITKIKAALSTFESLPQNSKCPREAVVLVACGSFSPITNLHLFMFETARNHLEITDGRYFVLGGFFSPVSSKYKHKSNLALDEHRLDMCKLAVADSTWLDVSSWEACQPAWSPTYNVLSHHSEYLNEQLKPRVPLKVRLLCGDDVLKSMLIPGLWSPDHLRAIFAQHGVAVLQRAGDFTEKILHESDLFYEHRNHISVIPQYIQNNVSSTEIRRALSRGHSVKYLIPNGVITYILEHGLFGSKKSGLGGEST